MELTEPQKQELYSQGFVKIPGVVPPIMVNAALKAINHSLGEGLPPEEITKFRAQTYCPELTRTEVITDLFNKTPALELAESAIGAGRVKPMGYGQIALRFPGTLDTPKLPMPHIDGMYSPTNGVPEGAIQNFTALGCVLLSDLTDDYAGNFTVWPGTHLQFEAYFREHKPQALLEGLPKVDMPEPQQIQGRAGDFVLAHYMLAHSAAINIRHNVRYAIFFRLKHVEHDKQKWESMTDIWLHWEGMRALVSAP